MLRPIQIEKANLIDVEFNNCNISRAVEFIALTKVFDIVSYTLLLQKLNNIAIGNK